MSSRALALWVSLSVLRSTSRRWETSCATLAQRRSPRLGQLDRLGGEEVRGAHHPPVAGDGEAHPRAHAGAPGRGGLGAVGELGQVADEDEVAARPRPAREPDALGGGGRQGHRAELLAGRAGLQVEGQPPVGGVQGPVRAVGSLEGAADGVYGRAQRSPLAGRPPNLRDHGGHGRPAVRSSSVSLGCVAASAWRAAWAATRLMDRHFSSLPPKKGMGLEQ